MKIHKITFKLSLLVVIVSFACSLYICSATTVCSFASSYNEWAENIEISFFASAVLLMFSSLIGYSVEEEKNCEQYYWKLIELRSKALEISTIPQAHSSWSDYYDAIVGINELITGYFATFDQNFIFCWRKKIQKIFQIHTALCGYKDKVIGAQLYIRQYMNDKKDENGNKIYNREKLLEDIREFCRETDNFMDEGSKFVIYLDKRIAEYQKLIR